MWEGDDLRPNDDSKKSGTGESAAPLEIWSCGDDCRINSTYTALKLSKPEPVGFLLLYVFKIFLIVKPIIFISCQLQVSSSPVPLHFLFLYTIYLFDSLKVVKRDFSL